MSNGGVKRIEENIDTNDTMEELKQPLESATEVNISNMMRDRP